ncbi:membrane protein [Gordonia phage Kabocha]|nr:membrane protein [Gordonia phage Kabocha]WNM67112.1 membrane protein [Gordonia Phage Schomber]
MAIRRHKDPFVFVVIAAMLVVAAFAQMVNTTEHFTGTPVPSWVSVITMLAIAVCMTLDYARWVIRIEDRKRK